MTRVASHPQDIADADTLLRDLTTAVATGQSVHGIAAVIHRTLGGTVVVADGQGLPLAHAGDGDGPPWPLPDWLSSCPDDDARAFRIDDWVLAVARPGPAILGVIGLHDPEDRAGTVGSSVLEQGALVLATELFRLRSVASNEVRVWGDLAAELLDNPDIERTRSHMSTLGYPLDRPHRALVIEAAGQGDPPSMATVQRAFRTAGLDGRLITRRTTDIVCLVEGTVDPARLAAALHEQGPSLLRLGVGDAHDPAELGLSVGEAELALRLSGAPVARFDDLGIARFLSADADVTRLRTFVDDWIGALVDYDRDHHSELVLTLGHSLRDQRSQRAAAEGLHIHSSTLKYRLRRIAELTGRDLHDPDTRFNLDLACRIRATLVSHHPPELHHQEELPLGAPEAAGSAPTATAHAGTSSSVEVAILDRAGVLSSVNAAWTGFCRDNGGDIARAGVGTSYLAVCAAADGDPCADLAATLVRLALAGDLPAPARLTVPCHSPDASRWFEMTVSSRHDDDGRCCGARVTLTPSTAP